MKSEYPNTDDIQQQIRIITQSIRRLNGFLENIIGANNEDNSAVKIRLAREEAELEKLKDKYPEYFI